MGMTLVPLHELPIVSTYGGKGSDISVLFEHLVAPFAHVVRLD